MFDLVGNPEAQFSRVLAHLVLNYCNFLFHYGAAKFVQRETDKSVIYSIIKYSLICSVETQLKTLL